MGFFNKLYWGLVVSLLGGVCYFGIKAAGNYIERGDVNNKSVVEKRDYDIQRAKALESIAEEDVAKEKYKEKNLESELRKVPIFIGYEAPVFQMYDKLIIEAVEFWNDFYKNEKNYVEPPLELIKRIMLVETAWRGKPVKEFYTDPMQVGKDFAYEVITRKGGEGLFPKGGVPALRNIPLDERTSIFCGVGWLIHKAAEYGLNGEKRWIIRMNYNKAVKKYNGGGDPNYVGKVDSLKILQRK